MRYRYYTLHMINKKINKEILRLAGPNIVSNISVPLLSTVDTILMGKESISHLGAVGIGSMIFNLIYWNFGFLRMGTTGLVAQAYGADNRLLIKELLIKATCLAIMLSTVVIVFQGPLLELCMYGLNVLPQQTGMVSEYYTIRIIAAPATFLLYAALGWYFGMQNAWYPLLITIAVNVINMMVSWYMVAVLGHGVAGVAWGTVIAQYSGLLLAVILLIHRYKSMLLGAFDFSQIFSGLLKFLNVNTNLFLRTVLLTSSFFFFYSQSSLAGELVLATNLVLLLFLNWMSYGIDGFAYAAESLVGKYQGSKDDKSLSDTVSLSLLWGLVLALGYTAVYGLAYDSLLSLFTDEQSTVDFAGQFYYWMILLPIISFMSYIYDGIYIGLTATKSMRDTMIIAFVIFLSSYYLLGGVGASIHNIWIAMSLLLFIRGIGQAILYHKFPQFLK